MKPERKGPREQVAAKQNIHNWGRGKRETGDTGNPFQNEDLKTFSTKKEKEQCKEKGVIRNPAGAGGLNVVGD